MTQDNAISIATDAAVLVAKVQTAQMEAQHAEALLAELSAAADRSPQLPVVLDLSAVTWLPSMGIGTLVALRKKIQTGQRRFVLAGLQPSVRQTLTACRLDKLFEMCDTADEARRRVAVP